MTVKPLITLQNVTKTFGQVTVIQDVTVSVYPGQVQVLLGENGAGKSTLIKMVAGVYQPDGGQILVDGAVTSLPSTRAAEEHGIATIHQELNLVATMSVAENVMLGRMPTKLGMVDRKELRRQARAALALIGLEIDVDTPVGQLGIARQQLVEIAKALSINARVLILDEPTAALTRHETQALFAVMADLRQRGVGMLFISHHLDEIAEVGDTVTVIRDGHFIAEVPASTPEDELVKLMVGRSIEDQFPRRADETPALTEVLTVTNLTSAGHFDDISFTVRAGEVLGIAGLVGAGRTELIRAIAGADKYDTGSVTVRGAQLPKGDIQAAIRAGIGHVPEDRKGQGLVLDASVNDNLGYATLASSAKLGLADFTGQRRRAEAVAEKLRIRMHTIDQPIRSLSGGNQQKAVFGRWIIAASTVLLLDEPTRGVDVGAKVEIYELMNSITAAGGAIVMVSSELPEILGMSDRILVMRDGRLAGELSAADATQDTVMTLAARDVAAQR
ncbi:sugar ABC transporter ATP-binding protein [Cryobacterium zongtaii]|uniref:Sugar ABC transporter ATP-binding protein n=1 Tax=Cryobacterium zongtaii TaxID=1259217 RepID=A0A2S3ZCC2_9MICO|nr:MULTISPECIES: sugar ABC transporter ATP-binding protein [Cryobacterium]POH63877.1 sugar ABC transporter ATP-binding protein [Cryobacterium zongtaii]TFC56857.1 sugar ABC transporter ATP-binding protein [Cryobacterium sp. TMB3-1-2]TFC62857.1 sugar ABC transporter ATP-binding protein [Cryobacterium sp. TMB1-7]TFC69438.1 sugar ABC transporter ATP-binding protein [Cryobacterium sp. TMB3-15]TFC77553.1 sugar ABC transporter ATP-binding protein [Cryobacterium sp. TMB3-10]